MTAPVDGVTDRQPELEISYSARSQVGSLVFIAGIGVLLGLAWLADVIPWWLGVIGVVEFAVFLVIGVVATLRMRDSVTVLRLERQGIRVGSAPVVPWSDVLELVVQPMKPAWLVGSKRTTTLCVIARPEVQLPRLPDSRGRLHRRGGRWTQRWYGTTLVLLPASMTATAEEIAQAAVELGGVETRWISHRPLRRWLWVLGVAVVAGIVVAGIRIGLH